MRVRPCSELLNMQMPSKRLVAVVLGLSGMAISHASGAAGPAWVGLVPPGSSASDSDRNAPSPGLWPRERQLGLKPMHPGRVTESAVPSATALTFYSEARFEPLPGFRPVRSYGGMRYALSSAWSSVLEGSVQSAHDAASRAYTLAGRLDRALPGGRRLSFGLYYSVHEYDARGIFPGAGISAHPAGQGLRHPYSVAHGSGYELKLSYRYGERNSVGLSYGSARDFDIARPWSDSLPAEGRQYSLTGRHWLTSEWSLSYGVMASEQGGPRGQGLRFGLGYSF